MQNKHVFIQSIASSQWTKCTVYIYLNYQAYQLTRNEDGKHLVGHQLDLDSRSIKNSFFSFSVRSCLLNCASFVGYTTSWISDKITAGHTHGNKKSPNCFHLPEGKLDQYCWSVSRESCCS